MRISADEFVEGGLTLEDAKAIAVMMEQAGLDMIHVSIGTYLSVDLNIASSFSGHGWFADWGKAVREAVKIPVIVVSRVNDPFLADEMIATGKCDLVAMGRASLADPALPAKAKEKRFADIRRCIGCNDGCVGVLFTDNPITCVLNPMLGHEYEGEIEQAAVRKKVAVVGAGPAGLYADIAAAKRGHDVVVYEKGKHAGGNFYTASIPPCKGEITDFIVWQTEQCRQLGVEIKYETEATAQFLKEAGMDTVILATGSNPVVPPVPGLAGNEKVCFARDLLEGRVKPGNECVVIGGGQVGAETAHFLAQLLRKVTVIEMTGVIAADAALAVNWHLIDCLEKRKVKMQTDATVTEITDEGVVYRDKSGELHTVPADTIVVAAGYRANNPLGDALKDSGIEVKVVGDAVRARKVMHATREGFDAGRSV